MCIRDSVNFNHVAASGCSNVKDVINAKHPLRNKIFNYYNSMVQSVQLSLIHIFYQAYTDYEGMMELTESMFRHLAETVCGTTCLLYTSCMGINGRA